MEKDIEGVIKTTQTLLGKYVKRPPLTDKLLKKPPFRFLHDIFTSVMKTTGFFEGLFDEAELISENVKDRDSKILFLNKVISVVGLTVGKTLSVKSSKIVAGQEPEKTNELLQLLAQALDRNISSLEAVQKVTNKVNQKEKKTIDTKKSKESKNSSIVINKDPVQKKENQDRSKTKLNLKKENVKIKKDPPKQSKQKELIKNISLDKSKDKNQSKESEKEDKSTVNLDSSGDSQNLQEDKQSNEENVGNEAIDFDNNGLTKISLSIENNMNLSSTFKDSMDSQQENGDLKDTIEQSEQVNNTDNIVSVSESKDISIHMNNKTSVIEDQIETKLNIDNLKIKTEMKANNQEETNQDQENTKVIIRPSSMRPSSSRPGAPRLKEKLDTVIDPENLLIGKVNIIVENTTAEEDEDSSILLVDHQESSINGQESNHGDMLTKEHGVLVHQILESQKELSNRTGKTEIEWEFGAQKAREVVNQKIETLKFNIQAVSRVANPLGKLLDHIQEDVEVMRQELHQWKNTHDESNKELMKQKMLNEDFTFPLQSKLKQLGMDIKDKHDKINDLRIIINKNSMRIEKLLAMGSVQ